MNLELTFKENKYKIKQLTLQSLLGNTPVLTLIPTLLFLFTCSILSAQTWTGSTNTDWHLATNWNTNTVPVASGDVIIPNTMNKPTVSTIAVAKSLNVQSDGLLTINAGGSLTISGSSWHGIQNFGKMVNSGTLNINQTNGFAINGESGSDFTNKGMLKIGSTANIGGSGIFTEPNASFTNDNGGAINIDRIGGDAIRNGHVFTNKGTISIGSIGSIARHGILNNLTFINQSGTISIDRTAGEGIFNQNPFTNNAIITIGANSNIGASGIMNSHSTFTNESGAITINQTNLDGIQNLDGGTFTNKATLAIGGLTNIGRNGILNLATFINQSGTLNIDRTSGNVAILNTPASSFTNKATITIGTVTGISTGIENNATFNNESGIINIDRTSAFGIYNLMSASFSNKAALNIGTNGFISQSGILNRGGFINTNTGSIGISQTNGNGLQTEATFTNQGTLNISALANLGANGIANFANPTTATFVNDFCGIISLNDNLFNNSSFTNKGLFKVNTLQSHDNNALTNNGLIEYPQGSPLSNVTNNGFIVTPKSGSCTFANVLQKGNSPNVTVATNWYKDAALTQLAGTYNPATNTLTAPNLSIGTNTLYFSVSDNTSGCPRTVSIKVVFGNTAPSVVLTSPANNAISVTNVTLSANATDPDGSIAQVNFYLIYFSGKSGISRTLIGSVNTAPYNFNWTNVVGGYYAIQAEAVDECGARVFSSISGINVLETFTVFISSPTTGQGFVPGSNLTITATVLGYTQRTVVKVEFFKDNIKLGEDFTAPYTYLWNNVPHGSYTLRAVATDNLGGVWSSPYTFILGINASANSNENTTRSIVQRQSITSIAVFPNPATDIVQIKTNIKKEGNYDLDISNALGRVVLSKQMTYEKGSYEEMIDVSEFTKGVYFVRLFNKNGQTFSVQKLIIH